MAYSIFMITLSNCSMDLVCSGGSSYVQICEWDYGWTCQSFLSAWLFYEIRCQL